MSKRRMEKMWPDSDEFVAEVSIPLPSNASRKLNVWLNLQYTGRRILGRDAIISDRHQEAAYQLHKCRRYKMKFKISADGDWTFVGFA